MNDFGDSNFSDVAKEFSSAAALNAFNHYFSKHEIAVFPYSNFNPHIQALYAIPQRSAYLLLREFCRHIGRPDLPARCTIEYVNEAEAQAYAASSGGFYHVAVAHSLPVLLQMVFQSLLAQTNPFSSSTPHTHPHQVFPQSLAEIHKTCRISEIEKLLSSTLPETSSQQVMTTKLAEIALLFCLTHEISHLIRGHAELAEKRGLIGINELTRKKPGMQGKRPISHRLSQAWELQADRTALAFLFAYVNNNKAYYKSLIKALKCRGPDASLNLIARVSYAISFVFFIFGQQQCSVASQCSHPSAITRQIFAMSELASIFLHAYPEFDEDTVTHTIHQATISAESAWHRLGFSFGRYGDDVGNLPLIIRTLFRRDSLSRKLLAHHQWSQQRSR
jgi:hypothetical protein